MFFIYLQICITDLVYIPYSHRLLQQQGLRGRNLLRDLDLSLFIHHQQTLQFGLP